MIKKCVKGLPFGFEKKKEEKRKKKVFDKMEAKKSLSLARVLIGGIR